MVINNYLEYKSFLTEHELKHAPKDLDHQGDFSLMYKGKRISIVGSSKTSPEGSLRTLIITRKLVKKEIIIVSDLTEGIDSIAHEAAIIEKGRTIVVLDSPIKQDYPKEYKSLFKFIKEHLIVFQLSLITTPKPLNSYMTKYTKALISDATIIIEVSEEIEVKHQAWEALRLGRVVLILESLIIDNKILWIKELLHYGAQVLNRNNFNTIIDDIPYLTAKSDHNF